MSHHPRSIQDLVVAVVGSSGGLGTAVTNELTARGARVIAAGRDPERLGSVHPGLPIAVCDIRDPDAGDRVVEVAHREFGRLDGVVNAAGIVAFGPLSDTPDIVIEELFLTDVIGPLWLTRRVLPALVQSRGFVAHISGLVAQQPVVNMVSYSATKAALSAASRTLSRELRRAGVHVLDIRPPHTETGLVTRAISGTAPRLAIGLAPEAVAQRIVDAIAAGDSELPAEAFQA